MAVKPKGDIYKVAPPGTIFLADSLFIDQQPIRVMDYLEFLSDIRRSYTPKLHVSIQELPIYNLSPEIAYHLYDSLPMDSNFYERMLTRSWQVVSSDKKIYNVDYYLLSSKYYNFPIVNVNYYQIFEFCRWRTDKVRLKYAVECKTLKQRKKYPINFKYRSAKRKEWELAMSTFYDNIGKLEESMTSEALHNVVAAYPLKSKGQFFYESENAAEYLDGDMVTTGFNFHEEYGIGDVRYIFFNKPTDWITFRCVFQILPDTVNQPTLISTPPAKPEKVVKPTAPKAEPKPEKIKGINAEEIKRRKKR
jgi:hypothetical protein